MRTRSRRISTIYAKTNSEYLFPSKSGKDIKVKTDSLRSGRLLDNVVMYLNFRERDRTLDLSDNSPNPSLEMESVIETFVSEQNFEQSLLTGKSVQERLLNGVEILDGIRWFHCITRSTFRLLLEQMRLEQTALNMLLSTVPKSNIVRQKDGSILLLLVSLTLDETKNVNMDQVSIYIQDNVIISFECLTSGNVLPDNMNNFVKNSYLTKHIEKTLDLPNESTKFDEFDSKFAQEYHVRMFIDEFAQTHAYFQEMKSKLKARYLRPSPQHSPSVSHPLILPHTLSSFSYSPNSSLFSCSQDISYFIYQSVHIMLYISVPVLNVYISHQKDLSIDMTFSPSHTTTHYNEIKDEISIIRSGLNLISNLTERTYLCLNSNTSLLTSLLSLRPEYTQELLDNYSIIFQTVKLLQSNLEQMHQKITDFEKKKGDQIKVALSMVSVFFFPIGFIASVYGQNFNGLGVISWFYTFSQGTNIFLMMNAFILFLTVIVIYHKGWGDTLGELHMTGNVLLDHTFNCWKKIFNFSDGIYVSKDEIETLISSRKGTVYNKLEMHTNIKRYQKRNGVGLGSGDRLRNFSI